MVALDASGSAATVRPSGVDTTYVFTVGLDTDFAHVSQVAAGLGTQGVRVGGAGTASGSSTDLRIAGALKQGSTDRRVIRFGTGLTFMSDRQANLGSERVSIVDVYVGPGLTLWTSPQTSLTLWASPRYLWLFGRDATYAGGGAEARLRYTWLFRDSHYQHRYPLGP